MRAQSYRAVFDPSGSTSTAHLAPSSVDLPQVNVRHTSRTSITAAERLSSGDVRIRGYVTFGSYFIAPDLPPVRIEFSPDSIGWTPVTTVPSTYLYVGGYAYEALLPQPSSGYWKAVYDGSPTYAKASTSTTVYVG